MTSTVSLTDQWTLVSTESVNFQVQGSKPAYIAESATLPTDLTAYKTAKAGEHLSFGKVDGNFYARAVGDTAVISIEPLV